MTRSSASRRQRRLAIKSTSRALVGTRPLFRYFDNPAYADALARGEVWITTLEACRNTENAARGDAGEATITYNTGTISGSTEDPDMRLALARMGVVYDGTPGHGTSINNQMKTKVVDAYVLCTTERGPTDPLAKMGRYCVRISNAQEFFERTTVAMQAQRQIMGAAIDGGYRPHL